MDSRLDRGLRALAWVALIATVAMLLATGAWLRPAAGAGISADLTGLTTEQASPSPAPMEE